MSGEKRRPEGRKKVGNNFLGRKQLTGEMDTQRTILLRREVETAVNLNEEKHLKWREKLRFDFFLLLNFGRV